MDFAAERLTALAASADAATEYLCTAPGHDDAPSVRGTYWLLTRYRRQGRRVDLLLALRDAIGDDVASVARRVDLLAQLVADMASAPIAVGLFGAALLRCSFAYARPAASLDALETSMESVTAFLWDVMARYHAAAMSRSAPHSLRPPPPPSFLFVPYAKLCAARVAAWRARWHAEDAQGRWLKGELMAATWHPRRAVEWCALLEAGEEGD
jgi:hypothetical protein